jgi:ABC-type sugar transport system ATPase subunit
LRANRLTLFGRGPGQEPGPRPAAAAEEGAAPGWPPGSSGEWIVECVDLFKTFGGVHALRGVSIGFKAGQITALVGDNGAGKSTLVKILGGTLTPDEGTIVIGGSVRRHLTPAFAADHGIEVVYQDLALCDNLTPDANIVLGREPIHRGMAGTLRFLDRGNARTLGRERVKLVGGAIPNWSTPVRELSGGQRQAIAIARATIAGHRMIVLDEPTAALGVRQTEATLSLVRNIADRGVAVVLIMHNLDQIFEISDRIVVLRLGEVSLDSGRAATNKAEVIAHMMGVVEDAPHSAGEGMSTP